MMVAKFVIVALLVATVNASGGYSSFSYGVSDPNTGDFKDQQENRVGGNVVGKYSLLESDGTKRIVEYSADDATGFKAVVHKEPVGALGAAAIGGHLPHTGIHGAAALGNPAVALANPLSHADVSAAHAAHAISDYAGVAHAAATHAAAAKAAANQAAAAHASKVAHANKLAHLSQVAAPFAHSGAISPVAPLAHSANLAASAPLVHAAPIAPLGATSPFGHGAYGGPLAFANVDRLAGQPGFSYAGNPLAGPLGYGNRGEPTVSSYSHKIVHNGPDAFPNGGSYGRYGANGYGGLGGHGAGLGGAAFGHANPWAAGPVLTHSNPLAASGALSHGSHGALATPFASGIGSRLGW